MVILEQSLFGKSSKAWSVTIGGQEVSVSILCSILKIVTTVFIFTIPKDDSVHISLFFLCDMCFNEHYS